MGGLGLHFVEDAALGNDDELLCRAFHGEAEQGGGAAHCVGHLYEGCGTFGMDEHFGLGMLFFRAMRAVSEKREWTWHAPSQRSIRRPVMLLI